MKFFSKKDDATSSAKSASTATTTTTTAATTAAPSAGGIKEDFDKWLAGFKKSTMGDDIIVKLAKVKGVQGSFTIKFDAEDDEHAFAVEFPEKYEKGERQSSLKFSSTDEKLGSISVKSSHKTLSALLDEVTKLYYESEFPGDEGSREGGDFDDDVFQGGDDDDDAMFGGKPQVGVSIAPKKKSKPGSEKMTADKFFTGDGSKAASERLIKDLQAIADEDTKKFGYEVETVGDNLYHWTARLFDFDGDLAKDMKKRNIAHITLEVKFPKDYPFSPPFIRVIEPRFAFHTGHVTIGGSICMELLTRSGWRPSNDIDAVLVQIRAEIMAGNARLDSANQTPYSEAEARAAFERVAAQHGWN